MHGVYYSDRFSGDLLSGYPCYPPVAGNFPIEDIESCILIDRVHLCDPLSDDIPYIEYVIHPVDNSAEKYIHHDKMSEMIRILSCSWGNSGCTDQLRMKLCYECNTKDPTGSLRWDSHCR